MESHSAAERLSEAYEFHEQAFDVLLDVVELGTQLDMFCVAPHLLVTGFRGRAAAYVDFVFRDELEDAVELLVHHFCFRKPVFEWFAVLLGHTLRRVKQGMQGRFRTAKLKARNCR